jgi:hypothetical protein
MSLLELLAAVASPELTASERVQLRALLPSERARALADAPWESSLVDQSKPRTREQVLEERVADLELALKVLADILAERGFLEPGSLPARVTKLKRDLAAEETARETAEKQQREDRQRAAQEKPVICVGCGAVVPTRESFASSRGTLCAVCHHDRE